MDFLLGIISKIPIIGKWAEIVSIGRTFKEAYKEFEEAEKVRKEAIKDRILTADEFATYMIEILDVFETLLPKYSNVVKDCDGFLISLRDSVDIDYNMDTKKITKVEFEG